MCLTTRSLSSVVRQHSVLVTEGSGQPVGLIFKCQAVILCGLLCPLKMEQTGCSEMSVINYNSTLTNIPEDRRLHLHQGRKLKSHFSLASP